MKSISFKLIFRSWWRNKTFAVISILSLAVGIACTNLLVAFVIHAYNVEADNPNKDRIYCLVQDNPFQSGTKVFYASYTIPSMIKDRYPEVEDCLCLNHADVSQVSIGEAIYDPIKLLVADASFPHFFPYRILAGNLEEALTEPNKIALTETTAQRLFGKENPIGQNMYIHHTAEGATPYLVVAVIKEHDQALLSFDGITAMNQAYGGTCFLLMKQSIDPEAFARRIKEDGLPTLMVNEGQYYLHTLQENYFQEFNAQTIDYLNKQNKTSLTIGLCSAFLILLIACFNYINLHFSRLLQQIRMIHIQHLMGASPVEINKQLFFDIFFTVIIGFFISLLIMYDLIPIFNTIFSGHMKAAFLFNSQVIPVLIGFILLLSIIPAIYVSRKVVTSFSSQHHIALFSGKGKQRIISVLSIAQFTISIALIIATLTVNKQVELIRKGGEAYRDLIEISPAGDYNKPFVAELRTHPELGEINTSEGAVLYSEIRQMAIPDSNGNNTYYSLLEFKGDTDYLSTFHIDVLQGMQPQEAIRQYARPVYINQRFADVWVGKENNPIGQPLKNFDKDFDYGNKEDGSKEKPTTYIAGIVDNFFTNSLEEEIPPAIIHIREEINEKYTYVYFRLDNRHPERIATVKQIWEKHNPGKLFTYQHLYETFIDRNRKSFGLVHLLLMYSLISIALTCFGLFGIALYSTEQRSKEIGIRKVNGATTRKIVILLNKQFLLWIGIAFLLAAPVSWILLNRWLQIFVYRINISVGIFIIALLSVTAITLLTISWHSYKAASGNPVKALKNE
ncbi:ABC transporter permease [Parabacteroides sp. 52]|uniref:ABC transporter permease n=1 Tax=unclassified Parabacteroides TaxID=2649774 RepID=UPI0013D3D178|nr:MULTISPECIES: FtsX-like permease family protein [unclassified Parabacteroides]MDH6533895.1 putative ABC transport system permease protein [Parabacteroides sp. PM5-20]NDV54640.1 ABC transporter permease [Parabacteroides sp. 52]